MVSKDDLPDLVIEALNANRGSASIVNVCRYVWEHYGDDLRRSGDIFFTWQYDIRWAATKLRKEKKMRDERLSPRGVWELVQEK
jgi:hypothetical protein